MTTAPVAVGAAEPDVPVRASLGELARYFTILGFTAFGGPAAHIAFMDRDLVEQRRWLSRRHFMDTLAAIQLVPGPNSTEMAIHVGYAHRGIAGMLVSGLCFIGPACVIVLALSIAYVALNTLPAVAALFYGIQPVIVAIVAQAAYRLALSAWRQPAMLALGITAVLMTVLLRVDVVWVLLGGGLAGALLSLRPRPAAAALALPFLIPWTAGPLARQDPEAPLWQLALIFLKIGATLLGSGYLLISYLETDLVRGLGWLTPQQLADSITVGQITPGPVFTTAAFVGYVVRAGPGGDVLQGTIGALVCAVAIFLPSFVIVWMLAPRIAWLRSQRVVAAFLDGVNAVVVGSIAVTTITLLQTAAVNLAAPVLEVTLGSTRLDLPAIGMALAALGVLIARPRLNSTWLIAAGMLIGMVVQLA